MCELAGPFACEDFCVSLCVYVCMYVCVCVCVCVFWFGFVFFVRVWAGGWVSF